MRRSFPPASAIAIALGLLCSAAAPPDEPAAPIDLVWHAPMACPGKQPVLDQIARRIGRKQRAIRAEAIVTREEADHWRARIRLSGEVEGTRDLTAESCDVLASAAALIIALAIDPQAASVLSQEIQDAEERQATPPEPAPELARDTVEPPEVKRETVPESPAVVGLVHSGVLMEQALVPDLAVGGLLGLGIQYAWVRADLTLSFVPLASATIADGRGADFSAAALAARGCAVPDLGPLEAGLCLGLLGTRLWAAGTNVPQSFSRHGDVLSVTVGPLLRWPNDSDWAAELSLETVIPTNHPAFVVENLGTVFEVPSVGMTGALAVGYRF